MADMKLFLGCLIPNSLPFIESTSRKLFDKLGIKTSDATFACCPEPIGFKSMCKTSWLAMGARNLCIAEAEGKDVVCLCSGCTQTLKSVQYELHDEDNKAEINEILSNINKNYKGNIEVKHFVQVLMEDVGVDKIKSMVTNPMSKFKVACHTGCHYNRPSEIMQWDDPLKPKFLHELVAATGATIVDYKDEEVCCGFGTGNTSKEVGTALAQNKMKNAKAGGANCLVVICPACFLQLDSQVDLPILYLTELISLSMGMSYDDLNMNFHKEKKNIKNLLA
ncbi:MAG: CoB--CoM heterodisulfide reductase iron-sulfur subunit B family protein [Candidatus Hodarchaeota archaeon]